MVFVMFSVSGFDVEMREKNGVILKSRTKDDARVSDSSTVLEVTNLCSAVHVVLGLIYMKGVITTN